MRKVLFPKRSQSRHPVDSGRLVVLTCSPRSFTFSIDSRTCTTGLPNGLSIHQPKLGFAHLVNQVIRVVCCRTTWLHFAENLLYLVAYILEYLQLLLYLSRLSGHCYARRRIGCNGYLGLRHAFQARALSLINRGSTEGLKSAASKHCPTPRLLHMETHSFTPSGVSCMSVDPPSRRILTRCLRLRA